MTQSSQPTTSVLWCNWTFCRVASYKYCIKHTSYRTVLMLIYSNITEQFNNTLSYKKSIRQRWLQCRTTDYIWVVIESYVKYTMYLWNCKHHQDLNLTRMRETSHCYISPPTGHFTTWDDLPPRHFIPTWTFCPQLDVLPPGHFAPYLDVICGWCDVNSIWRKSTFGNWSQLKWASLNIMGKCSKKHKTTAWG